MSHLRRLLGEPWWAIAHRGDKHGYPENRPAAFESAIEAGIAAIETDLRLSADGHVFVVHDAQLLLGDRQCRVACSSAQQLRAAGILELDELLEHYAGRTALLLELKTENETVNRVDRLVGQVIDALGGLDATARCAVLGFETRALAPFAERLPELPLIRNVHRAPQRLLAAIYCGGRPVDALDLAIDQWRPDLVEQLRELAPGVATLAWGVDDHQALRHGLDLGLDGMMSDDPHWLVAQR
jgi:glycerophosphoryl diester phosphodiesterase